MQIQGTGRDYIQAEIGNFSYLWYGIVTLWALFLMDVITTGIILSSGGYEMNALMRPVVESPVLHIILKMAALAVIAAVAYLSDKMTRNYGTLAVMTITVWYFFVVSYNIMQMAATGF